ncbi:MAG: DUF1667 domain-containing protein [Candidatus Omnitrophota bacterium]
MTKTIICTECPEGCILAINSENYKVTKVSGHKCPKGKKYASAEIENPVRILTSTVLTQALSIKMVPVRTDKPIPKFMISEAMKAIKDIRLVNPVQTGDVIAENFLSLNVNLIASRDAPVERP